MNLDQIETKCFILALFIRDDGERFLLGSRMFEFVDSQLHFTANAYQNDIVEVQGNDGVMLAGQVRRGTSQAFDGYIGDSSVDRSTIEQYRRDFMRFFRKNHYYKVVYIFTDGTAIQRRQGFIVEAPEVKELYQLFPKYHVSMNFEDINYYNYEEDSEGEEIYGESATLKIATSATGGLIWEDGSQTTISGEGSSFTLNGTIDSNVLDSLSIKGDITQQTYSGKNLFDATTPNILFGYISAAGVITQGGVDTDAMFYIPCSPNTTYTVQKGLQTTTSKNRFRIGTTSTVPDYNATVSDYWKMNDGGTDTSHTITTSNNARYLVVYCYGNDTETTRQALFNTVQVELGSTATTYEPYVGGIPAPNPNYPQTVNTVTGRQLVTVSDGNSQSQIYEVNLGKNLFDATNLLPASWSSGSVTMVTLNVKPNTQYTMSSDIPLTSGNLADLFLYDSSGSGSTATNGVAVGKNVTVTTKSDGILKVGYRGSHTRDDYWYQIELGSTATSYASYFTPIELCKIGDYQDYIYKSSGNWYVHKATAKIILDGSETWTIGNSGTSNWYYQSVGVFSGIISGDVINLFSNYGKGAYIRNANTEQGIMSAGGTCRVRYGSQDTTNNWKSKLNATNMVVYYPLATATDTQITNTALISQLEALAGATTYDGQTVFTVSSLNQLAILNVSVIAITNGGVVWDNYGAEWEEGTGGGPTMIDIESIDNVYPVWELTGPAGNPQISVLNTNTTLSYTGTITSSQTLKIDMFNKTATLNGASVIGNVSGDWVYLEPGINRVTYTTTNADAADSTIWWQEIVG